LVTEWNTNAGRRRLLFILLIGLAYYAQKTYCNASVPDKGDIIKNAAAAGVKTALENNADFVAEEIKRNKKMFDEGLISEEEFNQKRKKLLEL
jgi:hypothetical protein